MALRVTKIKPMNIIIGLLILSSIIAPIAIYKRSKSLKFRLIETRYSDDGCAYTPQARIGGKWLYLNSYESCYLSTYRPSIFLDAHDAIALIENFKSAGNFTIPSNRKLNSNEKQIIVE